MSGVGGLDRKGRLRIVDARDRASRLRQVYEATEEPDEQLLVDLTLSAVTFANRMVVYADVGAIGDVERRRRKVTRQSVRDTGGYPVTEAVGLIGDLEEEFRDLGYGKLLKP